MRTVGVRTILVLIRSHDLPVFPGTVLLLGAIPQAFSTRFITIMTDLEKVREYMSYIQELRAIVGHRPLILIGVLVMIFDENHRLLLKHRTDDGTWDFPGGFMEMGESTEETARREVLEETGLEIGEMTLFKIFAGQEFFYTYPNGDQVFAVSPVYVTNAAHGTLQPDGDEGSEVRFFPINELPTEMLPNVRMMIESFLQSHSM